MGNGAPKTLLRSLLVSYLLSGILLLLLAFGLYRFRLKESEVNIAVFVIYFFTCLVGGRLAGKRMRQRRFFWGMLTGLFYFLVLLAVSYLKNRGEIADLGHTMISMGICVTGGTLGGMLS